MDEVQPKPTVGRIIRVTNTEGETLAGIVTAVHSETTINATRFNADGTTSQMLSITKSDAQPTEATQWSWPPREF